MDTSSRTTDDDLEIFQKKISKYRGREITVEVLHAEIPRYSVEGDIVYLIPDETLYSKVIRSVCESSRCNFFDRLSCPMENKLVPLHELITDLSEIRMYRFMEFSRIRFSDPVVKWHGWKCNSFIRITRSDGSRTYRHLYCLEECDHDVTYTF